MEKGFYSAREAGEVLGVGARRVLQYIHHGYLKADRVGNTHVIKAEYIAEFNRNHPRKPGRPLGKGER